VDAAPEQNAGAVSDKLYRQMFSPVRWEESVRRMVKEGVEVFVEVGPQKVLTNLIKRIEPAVPCYSIEGIEDIEALKGVLA
jgi:[acyl-carrier-protein] S-malonyltransferase